MQQITPTDLAAWLRDPSRSQPVLIDVREDWEFELCHIEGAASLPLGQIANQYGDLDPTAHTVVICHHGIRSMHAADFLEERGFTAIFNLVGGVAAWAEEVDPNMRRY